MPASFEYKIVVTRYVSTHAKRAEAAKAMDSLKLKKGELMVLVRVPKEKKS